ncbi:MAG: YncE family protein [Dehalococcoidia bacterium]
MTYRSVTRLLLLGVVLACYALSPGPVEAQPRVVASIDLAPEARWPMAVAVDPTNNRIYVANYDTDNVSVIDGATNTVVATVPVGHGPSELAVNPATNRIYVVSTKSDNRIFVIDGATNTVATTITMDTQPRAVAVDPVTNRVYVTQSDALGKEIVVIDGAANSATRPIVLDSPADDIAVNPHTNRIYVVDGFVEGAADSVSVVDGRTRRIVAKVPVGRMPLWIVVNALTNRIYVATVGGVSVIDGASNTVEGTLPSMALALAVDPATDHIYTFSDNISVYDGATNAIIATVPLEYQFDSVIAPNPTTGRVYVTDVSGNKLLVIEDQPAVVSTPTAVPTTTQTPAPLKSGAGPTPDVPIIQPATGDGPGRSAGSRGVDIAFALAGGGAGGALLLAAGGWLAARELLRTRAGR